MKFVGRNISKNSVNQFREVLLAFTNGVWKCENQAGLNVNKRFFSAMPEQYHVGEVAEQLKQVKFNKDLECSVTIVGRVLSGMQSQQLRGSDHSNGFMVSYWNSDRQNSYCTVQIQDGKLQQQFEQQIKLGDIIAVKGYLHTILSQQLQVVATRMASVVDCPQYILDLPTTMPFLPSQNQGGGNLDYVPEDLEGKWLHMLQNPQQWWDMREDNEQGSNRPAFKHRTHKDRALWVNSQLPLQYMEALQDESRLPERYPGWKVLLENPEEFWDNHNNRKNDKFPHFIHKKTGAALWYDGDRAPQEVRAFYQAINTEGYDGSRPSEPWEDLFQNPGSWIDRRQSKTNQNSPDFIHHEPRQDGLRYGLWLDSCKQEIKDRLKEQEQFGIEFASAFAF
eukprot:TRINITY_DN4484_c0_g1_i6.p1 TRINITY_DN4484_c0_g1~~TRINITY_DN4484_c0_g1_i6.p1  ORF type:complete len:393 (-),score=50.24 TRINITY_DN4484_c0_g1_i6:216-1394(-)